MSTYSGGAFVAKFSKYLTYRGSATAAALNLARPKIGDVYDITEGGTLTDGNITVQAGDAVLYLSNGWTHCNNNGADAAIATLRQEFNVLKSAYLDEIKKGTTGDFVNLSVTSSSNHKQSINLNLTVQNVETADNDNKGLAESKNVKDYILRVKNDIMSFSNFYGVQWDTSNPSPECTRIGNLTLHATLPVQSQIIGGVMTDDGTFTPFSNQADWTSEIRDGSTGQVMVKLPQFYAKFETVGTINRVLFSHLPILGFITIPEMYISAYQATIDRTNNKLASVRNFTAQYRGGNNQSAWDNEDTAGYGGESHRSVLGRPASNKSLNNFRNLARNRNNGDTRWNCMMYEVQRTLYWLYVVEYATLNSQKDYNAELSAEGYSQGGLGDGVSNWTDGAWNSFNGYYGFVPCGWTDEFGNQTGVKNYTVYNASGTELLTTNVPRYRGIENPFGHLWQWTDGILVDCQSASSGGLSPVYICTDPSKFSSSSYGDYQFIANEFRTNNYVKNISFWENGDIIGTIAQSSSTSYYCDYHYVNIPASGTSLRGVRFGGRAAIGADCGFVYSSSDYVPSHSVPYIGSRLCFKP